MTPNAFRNVLAATVCALAMSTLPARADDSARISNLESEIQRLRTQVAEQNRRIQRLEAQLEQGTVAAPDYKSGRRTESATPEDPGTEGPLPWRSPEAWQRVAIGMSQDETIAILGEPTAVEAVDNYMTLFYSDGAAGGEISGHVNLKDDLVVAIKKPTSR